MRAILFLALVLAHPLSAQIAQKPQNTSENGKVVLSDKTSTARVADPNELIGVNGHVLRVKEFMALLSADTSLVQRLHNLEMQNSSDSPQVGPVSKTHSDSPSPAVAPAGSVSPPVATPEKH